MKHFDVIVIGSGMGGMCTAARLVQYGYRVLVIELLSRIGGRCSTRYHKGFKLTTGVIGIECGGAVEQFFQSLELPFDVLPGGSLGFLINGVPTDIPKRGGMKSLLKAAGEGSPEIEKLMAAVSRGYLWQAPSSDLTLKEWLAQYTDDTRLAHVFRTLASAAMMVDMDEITVAAFFDFFSNLKQVPQFGYAPGGPVALPARLEKYILDQGGEVWTGAEAKRIRVENGVARGVLVRHLSREEEIEASAVVSNAGPRQTARLAGRQHLDLDDLRILEKRLRPVRAICLHIGTDRLLGRHSHLWVTGCRRITRLYQPTAVCPDLAPDNRHLLVALATVPRASGAVDMEAELGICRGDLDRIFPDFGDHAEILAADTFQRDWPAMHARPGRDAPSKTSIINLYNVGDGAKPPGTTGLPAVVAAAERCAGDIRRRISLIESTTVAA